MGSGATARRHPSRRSTCFDASLDGWSRSSPGPASQVTPRESSGRALGPTVKGRARLTHRSVAVPVRVCGPPEGRGFGPRSSRSVAEFVWPPPPDARSATEKSRWLPHDRPGRDRRVVDARTPRARAPNPGARRPKRSAVEPSAGAAPRKGSASPRRSCAPSRLARRRAPRRHGERPKSLAVCTTRWREGPRSSSA